MNRKECILLGEQLSSIKPLELKGEKIIQWIKTKKFIEEISINTIKLLEELLSTYNIHTKPDGKTVDFDKTKKEDFINYTLAERTLFIETVLLPEYSKMLSTKEFTTMYKRIIKDSSPEILELIYINMVIS